MPTALHADRLAIVARYREDVDWLQHAPIPYQVVDKGGPSSSNPNVGGDATSYLSWILANYHSPQLPQWMLFMHAHEYHWHHARYSQLRSMRIDLEATGRGYLSISHVHNGGIIHFTKDLLAELSDEEHNQLRRDLLGLQTPYSGRVKHAPCGQFWVRRDRLLARPKRFYQRLFDALTDATHPLLSRRAAAEGYPERMLHVYFIEGYWHWVFGEALEYDLPFRKYDQMPLLPMPLLSAADGKTPSNVEKLIEWPPLTLTPRGLHTQLQKQPLWNATATHHSSSPRSLLSRVAHGCDCKNQGNTKPPETCKRAADAAVRLLLRMEADIGGGEDGDYCGGGGPLNGLLEPLPSEARDRIRIMSRMCFGGVGGPRDFALTAVVECLRRVPAA